MVISGTLLIWTLKFIIRPFVHIPYFLKALAGIAPNLIGSFLLPFSACWMFSWMFGMRTTRELKIACWSGLTLVVINEYLQLIPLFGRTFDYFDIVSSFIGLFLGYRFYAGLMAKTQFKTFP